MSLQLRWLDFSQSLGLFTYSSHAIKCTQSEPRCQDYSVNWTRMRTLELLVYMEFQNDWVGCSVLWSSTHSLRYWCMTSSYFEITHWAAICVPLCNSITCQSIVLRAVQTFKRASMQAKLSEAHTLPSTLGCISTPRLFSNNFYLVLKCCIFVKNETSKIFCNWLIFRGASGLPKFDPGSKTCK